MLRTGFIGSDNLFDKYVCGWLREHSDLRLIIWTDELRWARRPKRWRKVASRYRQRAKRHGWRRSGDELLYYALYHPLLRQRESQQIQTLIEEAVADSTSFQSLEDIQKIPPGIREIRPDDIQAPELIEAIKAERLDALFSVCIDVLLPEPLISAPRLGAFLWHEGITPEYRGVYSPFWALANQDYGKLGYTLLKMDMKLDAGDVFVQGNVRDVDVLRDSPTYIGHKGILESLEESEQFLKELERGKHKPLERVASEDRCYSYPTASALGKIIWQRQRAKLSELLGRPVPKPRRSRRKSHSRGFPPARGEDH